MFIGYVGDLGEAAVAADYWTTTYAGPVEKAAADQTSTLVAGSYEDGYAWQCVCVCDATRIKHLTDDVAARARAFVCTAGRRWSGLVLWMR